MTLHTNISGRMRRKRCSSAKSAPSSLGERETSGGNTFSPQDGLQWPPTTFHKVHEKLHRDRFSKMEYARSPEAAPVKRGPTRCFRTSNRSRSSFKRIFRTFPRNKRNFIFHRDVFGKSRNEPVRGRAKRTEGRKGGGGRQNDEFWYGGRLSGTLPSKTLQLLFDQKVVIVAVCEFCKCHVLALLGRNQGRQITSWVQLQPVWQQRRLSNLYRGKCVFTPGVVKV